MSIYQYITFRERRRHKFGTLAGRHGAAAGQAEGPQDRNRFQLPNKKERRTVVVHLFCLLGCLFFLSACSSRPESGDSNGQPPADDQLVIHLPGGDWGYPTPYAHYPRGPGGFKMALIFDSLLERGEKNLIPWLAESWEVSPDGRHYLFTIRKGVKWQDGRPLTPEDVKFSFEYANRHPMVWSHVFEAIERVELAAANQVRITVNAPSATMLYSLGITRILPKHIWEDVARPKEFTGPPAVIGSGPYRLTDYSKEHGTYRFEAFSGFWGPKPQVFAIEYIPVGEEILAYEKGEIDLVTVPADLLPRFRSDPSHIVRKSPAFWGYRLLFNFERAEELKDVRVRRAFAHAIDKKELVDKVARGAAVAGRAAILPPDHVMAAEDVVTYPFDPRKSNHLLLQAGYKEVGGEGGREDGDGNRLAFSLLCSNQEIRLAEVLRQRLSQVGIHLAIESKDGKSRDAMVARGDYQLAVIGHGGWGGDADYLAQRFADIGQGPNLSPSNSGMLTQMAPDLIELLKRQRREFDPRKRREMVYRIQRELSKAVPEIPLFYTTNYTVYRPEKYNGWRFMYDHHSLAHGKLSYLESVKKKTAAADREREQH